MHKAEIYPESRSALRRWRYRIKAGNGEIIAASQSYSTKYGAKRAASINHPDASIVILDSKGNSR